MFKGVEKMCSFHVHWKGLSFLWFNTQERFAEHTGWSWVYRSLDYVLCHSFLVEYSYLYLSIFCESQQIFNTVIWRLARSHRSLDNSFHRWHILLFVPFLSKKWVFWKIWSKVIGFVVIRVIQCTMLTISSVPTMVIYIHVPNYAYRLLYIYIISFQK